MHLKSFLVTTAAFLTPLAAGAGFYSKSSPVLEVNGKNYEKLIKLSDKVSIVEFYAPWCGHCQNLKPAYEKAAKSLAGLANVAAINCDDDDNKPFCGQMGVQGFPTLKMVKFGKKGKPVIQDYTGPRTASGIVEAVGALIPNTVKKITDEKLQSFLEEKNSTAKTLIFSVKGTTSNLVKVLSNEYGDNMVFAQIRDKETEANKMFGIEEYPTVVVLPGGERNPVVYGGKIEKQSLNMFLSSYADTWSYDKPKEEEKKEKKNKKDKKKAESSDSSKFAKASASHASKESTESEGGGLKVEFLDEDEIPFESPRPIVNEDAATPVPIPEAVPAINELETYEEVQRNCLGPKTQTCVLAFFPGASDPDVELPEASFNARDSLAKIAKKHKDRGDHLFPFYAVPESNPGYSTLKNALGFSSDSVELFAVNGKRSWYRHHDSGKGFGLESVEGWIDGIRFGEGKKERLPEGLVVEVPPMDEPIADEPLIVEETSKSAEDDAAVPEEEEPVQKHDEL